MTPTPKQARAKAIKAKRAAQVRNAKHRREKRNRRLQQIRNAIVARELSLAAKFRKERRQMYHKITEITPDTYLPVQDWAWLVQCSKTGLTPEASKRLASNASDMVAKALQVARSTTELCAGGVQLSTLTPGSVGGTFSQHHLFGQHGHDYWWVRHWRGPRHVDGATTVALRISPDQTLSNQQLHALCDLLFVDGLDCKLIRIAYANSGQYYEQEAVVTAVFGSGPMRETWWCPNGPIISGTQRARRQRTENLGNAVLSPQQHLLIYKQLCDPGSRLPVTMLKPEKRKPSVAAERQWVPDF